MDNLYNGPDGSNSIRPQGSESVLKSPLPGQGQVRAMQEPPEIACIETTYVYDSCFVTVQRELTNTIPEVAEGLDPEADYTVDCEILTLECSEIGRTPTDEEGYYNVTLRLQYTVTVSITQGETLYYEGPVSDVFIRTLRLCAPEGTTVDCSRFSTLQCQAFVTSFDEDLANVQLFVSVCLITQSYAVVQLLVGAYGFCVPAECTEVSATIPCPPNLFPAGCNNIVVNP